MDADAAGRAARSGRRRAGTGPDRAGPRRRAARPRTRTWRDGKDAAPPPRVGQHDLPDAAPWSRCRRRSMRTLNGRSCGAAAIAAAAMANGPILCFSASSVASSTCASNPRPAASRNCSTRPSGSVRRPRSIGVGVAARNALAVASGARGMPISRATTFVDPPARIASRTPVPASSAATSRAVPSPPAARMTSAVPASRTGARSPWTSTPGSRSTTRIVQPAAIRIGSRRSTGYGPRNDFGFETRIARTRQGYGRPGNPPIRVGRISCPDACWRCPSRSVGRSPGRPTRRAPGRGPARTRAVPAGPCPRRERERRIARPGV